MGESNYYILNKTEDGIQLHQYSKSELQKLLSYDKEIDDIGLKFEIGCNKFLTFDEMNSEDARRDSCMIIKGEVVIPIHRKLLQSLRLNKQT